MDNLERKKSAGLKETNNLLNLEAHFVGFDINDEVLIIIENKKKSLKMELSKETGEPMEVDEPTDGPPIVNNNHVNKKKQSKSSISPEPNDKTVRSNKRQKKDNTRSNALESSESLIPLEFSTPTFNLTSSNTRTRRSTGRKMNVDISDAIFKLPFEHGWKRELVYRTSGESTIINRSNRNGDVYYYSPNNRKLRSLREIQEQLDISSDKTSLTIDSFTFLKQPIGMNDRSKEIIRDANSKLSKEDSFVGVAVRPKKSKTPVQQRPPYDYELSDDENNKSANKMKIVFKNAKTSRSRSKKGNSELMNTSSSTPEYVSEDWQAIQSSVSPNLASPKLDNVDVDSKIIKRRLSTSDGEVIMQTPCGIRCPNSDEPATLMCAQCLVYYHPACVNLNANLKIVGYVCINCRSTMRQRNRRVQSSHTVIVGATEPEQLRVEPIRIRQVHQASDTPNFFIDRTPISPKIEEPHYETDEYSDESDSDLLNTVICQGNAYKTSMVDGSFHEQYVYEMKQTRGPSLMTCVIQEPKNLDENFEMNGSVRAISTPFASMQSFNYMVKALRHVFKHLKTNELLSASRVCTAWHIIAMNKFLWQNVRLKNSMVYDWERFVDSIDQQRTDTLDTRRMLIPVKIEEFENFWLNFAKAMKRAQKLKFIELYRCPTHVVEDIIYSLPQLEILNATSIKNPNVTKEAKNTNDFMVLNLNYLGQMTKLTELRLKGLTGIKLTSLPSFGNLVNLNKFSLTSIKSFPNDICQSLDTITDNIEFLEIGDCDCLPSDFALSLKRFVNLKSLRLENCCGKWESFAQDVFTVIRGLEKLTILELINIEFSNCVEDELEKCLGIKALLIIPAYVSQSATTNCHLIDCLKKLSKTLTHLVWGLTHELLRVTDLFITQYQQNQHSIGYNLELSHTKETTNNIPILRTRKPRQRPGDEPAPEKDKDKDKSDNVDILSVPALEKLLDTMMPDAKTKVIKVPFSGTVRVYLSEQFNDL
ncbi:uncharacterized protein LOC112600685 isoform X1 [Melanaphis sacchari]|uniref:uncharacterized protein LOC112600685 isoform X1 n=1 Tax=Melanaphis sacchari TaxID=742174 RepID=UPI000DC14927|nr:uncharacterized protein LOC112600685 isoform X1 [Melanaphis sacchari]